MSSFVFGLVVLCQFDVCSSLHGPVRGGRVFVGPVFVGEFDPGSGRTLAACLTHASRAVRPLRGYTSGERVSNTWVTCPSLWDKPGKLGLIPDIHSALHGVLWKVGLFGCSVGDGPAAYQLVGGVMAYQGGDG